MSEQTDFLASLSPELTLPHKKCIERIKTTNVNIDGESRADYAIQVIAGDCLALGLTPTEAFIQCAQFASSYPDLSSSYVNSLVRKVYEEKKTFGCDDPLKAKYCSALCPLFQDLGSERKKLASDTTEEKALASVTRGIGGWPYTKKVGKQSKPISCIENVEHLLKAYNIIARYNVIAKEMELLIPGSKHLIDNEKNEKMNYIVSIASQYDIPIQKIPDYVEFLAGQNLYNPVARWIESKPWDGQTRLEDIYDTVRAYNEHDKEVLELKKKLIRKWLISCVASALDAKGVSVRGVLVFRGKQYLGKTKWFKRLVPEEMKLTREGMLLNPQDKDSVFQSIKYWLVELGELDATFKRADIAQLKSFITNSFDELRTPYARYASRFIRRTTFFGSVNEEQYLNDPTGNTRFWTIDCESIDFNHHIDMQQLWAEVETLWRAGEPWWLSDEEMELVNFHNQKFETPHPTQEKLDGFYPWPSDPKNYALWRLMTATDVAMEMGIQNPSKSDLNAISKRAKFLSQKDAKKSGSRRLLFIPKR